MAENYSYVDPKTGEIWQKVLFHRSKFFPDNFTPDECFLAAIKRNQNLHKYTLQQCLFGATQVSWIFYSYLNKYLKIQVFASCVFWARKFCAPTKNAPMKSEMVLELHM